MPTWFRGKLKERYVLRLKCRCRGKGLIVFFTAFVHLTAHKASTHIGLGTITLVGHNQTITHEDVFRHGPHVLKGVDLPNMFVEVIKFVNIAS